MRCEREKELYLKLGAPVTFTISVYVLPSLNTP